MSGDPGTPDPGLAPESINALTIMIPPPNPLTTTIPTAFTTTTPTQSTSTPTCRRCGGTNHSCARSKLCPFFKPRMPRTTRVRQVSGSGSDTATATPRGQGSVRHGRGGGRGRGSGRASSSAEVFEFKAQVDEYDLVYEEECLETLLDGRFKQHIGLISEACDASAQALLGRNYDDNEPVSLFVTLAEEAIGLLTSWMKKESLARGLNPMQPYEVNQTLAVIMFSDLINLPLKNCIQMLEDQYARKFQEKITICQTRFTELFRCIRGSNPSAHTPRGSSWSSTIDTIRFFRDFEEKAFEPARRMLLTCKACLVIDDELVGCRSSTVQSKAISNRKAGKEGLKNDGVACSLTRVMVAVKHKQRIGYNQHETVEALIQLLNGEATEGMIFAADRGYGCIRLWRYLASIDMGFVMISNSYKTTGHPFVNQSEYNKRAAPMQATSDEPTDSQADSDPILEREVASDTSPGTRAHGKKFKCV